MAEKTEQKRNTTQIVIAGLVMAVIIALGANAVTRGEDNDEASSSNTVAQAEEENSVVTEAEEGAPETNTVVDIAVNNGFDTLVAAVTAADLVETLSGEGPFTVFAPTDEAFAKLPEGTLDDLLKPENKQQLSDILTYHVVAGDVRAADVVDLDGQNVDTVLGQEWHVLIEGERVFIADPVTAEKIAEVVQTDVIGDNGVVHIIDSVLLPQ